MTSHEWHQPHARCLGMYLSGVGFTETDATGRPLGGETFLVIFNAHHDRISFKLPDFAPGARWELVMDTALDDGLVRDGLFDSGAAYVIGGRSLALLQQHRPVEHT
jgi:glycogen operon protein